MADEAMAARMEAEHYSALRERELAAGKPHVHAERVKCYPACPAYKEPAISLVTLYLCELCIEGVGGSCNVPGCALCRCQAPDLSLRGNAHVLRIEPT